MSSRNHSPAAGAYAEQLVEESAEALIAISPEGSILYWNAGASATFGYGPEEAVGKQLHELVAAESEREELRVRFSRVRTAGHQSFEATRRRKDGGAIRTDVSARLVRDSDGRPAFIALRERDITLAAERQRLAPLDTVDGLPLSSATRDISERKRFEAIGPRKSEELEEQNRRMLEANRLKSEFLANMSHKHRAPLHAIIGFADLMHRGKVGPLSDTHREYLGDILDSSRHLLQLINDVLDLAKVESGKMVFRPEPTDVAETVTAVRDILRGLAAAKRIRIDLEVSPEVVPAFLDPGKLKQVLYNYLSNALKFTPEEGRVTIRAAPESDGQLRIEVEDTGIGISPDDISRLFVEFQQLDAGTSKRYAGSGLGLALTKRIVEAQGGSVAVRSEPGRGSLFSCVLPLRADEASNPGAS